MVQEFPETTRKTAMSPNSGYLEFPWLPRTPLVQSAYLCMLLTGPSATPSLHTYCKPLNGRYKEAGCSILGAMHDALDVFLKHTLKP